MGADDHMSSTAKAVDRARSRWTRPVANTDPWAHYMACEALMTVELVAQLLGCAENEVVQEVRRLTRTR